jgi:hypothetical protein
MIPLNFSLFRSNSPIFRETCISPVSFMHGWCCLKADDSTAIQRANDAGVRPIVLINEGSTDIPGPWSSKDKILYSFLDNKYRNCGVYPTDTDLSSMANSDKLIGILILLRSPVSINGSVDISVDWDVELIEGATWHQIDFRSVVQKSKSSN